MVKQFILDIPFKSGIYPKAFGATFSATRSAWVYKGDVLPDVFKPYLPSGHNWLAYQYGTGSGHRQGVLDTNEVELRTDQKKDRDTLRHAFAAGAPEVLIASKVGTGKTYTALALSRSLTPSGKILIVCPSPVIPAWEESIAAMGEAGKRYCIIGYGSLHKLFKPVPKPPKNAVKARQQRLLRGAPIVSWDVVIFDEAHYLGNPEALRSRGANRLQEDARYTIKMSATIADNPLKMFSLYRGIMWGTHTSGFKPQMSNWIRWCTVKGLTFTEDRNGKKWSGSNEELKIFHQALFKSPVTWSVRTDPGWDDIRRYRVPLRLSAEDKALYEFEWNEFQKVTKASKKVMQNALSTSQERIQANQSGFAALVRYRQKAGILKAPYVAERVLSELENDNVQVAISCEFHPTLLALKQHLKIPVAEFHGKMSPEEKERDRKRFQRGDVRVIIFTVNEGVNLQAGERGGNNADRIQIVAEPSNVPLFAHQKEGRTNRNGKSAPVMYMAAQDTTDTKIINTMIERIRNLTTMMGEEAPEMDWETEMLVE